MAQWSVGVRNETELRNGMRVNVAARRPRVERRWKTKEGPAAAGYEGDLCSMHKGLAQFFDDRRMVRSKCMK